jgi:hypothetical protein
MYYTASHSGCFFIWRDSMNCEKPSARIDRNTEEDPYTIKDAIVF